MSINEKYLKKIEKRKFKNLSPFRTVELVVDTIPTGISLKIVKKTNDFYEYVSTLNESIENEGYIVTPMNNIKFTNLFFDNFDVFIVDNSLTITKQIFKTEPIDQYYNNVLIIKKNIAKIIHMNIKSKINFKRII